MSPERVESRAATWTLSRFSTDALPKRDRMAIWREEFGRKVARFEFDPLDETFRSDVTMSAAPGLKTVFMDHAPLRASRTRQLLADGNDDLMFQILTTDGRISHRGREVEVGANEAILLSSAEICEHTAPVASKCMLLMLPRRDLRAYLSDFDGALARRIPAKTPALRLLAHYIGILQEPGMTAPEFRRTAVAHIYDLIALALGATQDAAAAAMERGVRAARLRSIKDVIQTGLGRGNVSVGAIAAAHGVTPRYVQGLFASEGTTLTEFVLDKRLSLAYRMLCDPRLDARNITSIAYDAGFGDISYFNKVFRRRFGETPTGVRSARGRQIIGSEAID
jgi:AraC-like DNA-binding protein